MFLVRRRSVAAPARWRHAYVYTHTAFFLGNSYLLVYVRDTGGLTSSYSLATPPREVMDVIARLDAELLAVAAAAEPSSRPQPPVIIFSTGCLAGWMFGGALAGPGGLVYGTLMGAIAGGYRAYTGRHIAEVFANSNSALPRGKFLNMSSAAAPLPNLAIKSSGCGPGAPAC